MATIFLACPGIEPNAAIISNFSGLSKSRRLKVQEARRKAMATPPWELPLAPGSLLRTIRPSSEPSLRSSISSCNVGPSVNHVSVIRAMSVFNSVKQSMREWILGHRDLEFVLIIVSLVFDLFVFSLLSSRYMSSELLSTVESRKPVRSLS